MLFLSIPFFSLKTTTETNKMNGHQYRHALCALLTKNMICILQKVQNDAAHLICHSATYFWSLILFTGFLSNLAFCAKFLSLNHWTTKPLPISTVSSSCMFGLANSVHLLILDSFIFHPLTSYAGPPAFLCQALWNDLPYSFWHSSSVASFKSTLKTQFSPLDPKCIACVHVAVYHWFCTHVLEVPRKMMTVVLNSVFI